MDFETKRRLQLRADTEEKTLEDVIKRLLDETTVEVAFEEIIKTVLDQYDNVVSVYVNHLPTHENPTRLKIFVFTSEAKSVEEPIEIFGPEHRAVVSTVTEDEPLRLPFRVFASCDGPKTLNVTGGTPIFMSNNVVGAEPLELETGLKYLRHKLGNPDWEVSTLEAPPEDISNITG